ncbi:unnamed protein product, partial [Aphanomyces euteiches]
MPPSSTAIHTHYGVVHTHLQTLAHVQDTSQLNPHSNTRQTSPLVTPRASTQPYRSHPRQTTQQYACLHRRQRFTHTTGSSTHTYKLSHTSKTLPNSTHTRTRAKHLRQASTSLYGVRYVRLGAYHQRPDHRSVSLLVGRWLTAVVPYVFTIVDLGGSVPMACGHPKRARNLRAYASCVK